jgi:hypothetical protein
MQVNVLVHKTMGHGIVSSQKPFTFCISPTAVHDRELLPVPECTAYKHFLIVFSIHGHRTLKTPHPVRSAQLTKVPPS